MFDVSKNGTQPDGNYEIYIMSPDGSNQKKLTETSEHDIVPTWSPDSKYMAFEYSNDIYVIKADGTGERNLTNSPERDEFAVWSPPYKKFVC